MSQDFLQMKEKWTRKNNEDVDEQDARQEFAQTKTRLVDRNCVRQDCFLRMEQQSSREVLKSFRIDYRKVHL